MRSIGIPAKALRLWQGFLAFALMWPIQSQKPDAADQVLHRPVAVMLTQLGNLLPHQPKFKSQACHAERISV